MAVPSTEAVSLLDLINRVDNVPFDFETNFTPYYRLFLAPDPRPHGYIHPETIARLPWPSSFAVDHGLRAVTLAAPSPGSPAAEHASAAFQLAVDAAIASGDAFPTLNGRHSEHFRLLGASGPRGIVGVERFAATLFGIATRGAHMTAYVRSPDDGAIKIWVARRSRSLFTYPGMLDSTVAGGVKATDTPLACILAESEEEASLPRSLVSARVRSTGVITLANRNPRTELFHSEVLYTYDLELPAGTVPQPADDEVEAFELMGCEEVRERMAAGEFKPNVCPVMIDFLVRHGVITPEGEGEDAYVGVCSRLRRRLPVPTGPWEGSVFS